MYFNITFTPSKVTRPMVRTHRNNNTQPLLHPSIQRDSFSFTGRSQAFDYDDVFEYLASEILDAKAKVYGVDGSMLSANKINSTLGELNDADRIFLPYKKTVADKIKWKSYIPQDIREGSVEKVNIARDVRMNEWRSFLEHPEFCDKFEEDYNPELIEKIKENNALKLVIWDAVTSELSEKTRHIPVPLNKKALLETIEGFEEITPKDRQVRCHTPKFIEMYTHRLRDNLLMDMGLANNTEVWVRIPSLKHDKQNKEKNVSALEILSCKNWCTRSSVDKAKDALADGDFHIYLTRGKYNLWEPRVGMTMAKGKIDQIQGIENDNLVPLTLLDKIKKYINENDLKCHSLVIDEGPKAQVALMISDKLNEIDPDTKKTFAKAIKDQDNLSIFKHLGVKVKALPNGGLVISNYRPSYPMVSVKGISVPYSMFGINEDKLLSNVEEIKGNLVLYNYKNKVHSSTITTFPPNLKKVGGNVVCNKKQYEEYHDNLRKVMKDNFKRNVYVQQ